MPADFESFLGPNREISAKVSHCFESSEEGPVILFIVDLKNYSPAISELLRIMQSKNLSGVYLTINKPVDDLLKALQSRKINTGKIFFIDAISALSERDIAESENIAVLDSPSDLTEMNNLVAKRLSNSPRPDFVVFDSLSTLLLYNKPMSIEKFIHVLVGKIRGSGSFGFLIAIKSAEHAGLVETISQFVDRIIEL